ncbi:MAG: hypothetical protein K2L96_08540 [Muribaculaceae bacterium]|nr:hypothetical protein [Muribaculaceae bacterium]
MNDYDDAGRVIGTKKCGHAEARGLGKIADAGLRCGRAGGSSLLVAGAGRRWSRRGFTLIGITNSNYDHRGLLVSHALDIPGGTLSIGYKHDADGNLLQRSYTRIVNSAYSSYTRNFIAGRVFKGNALEYSYFTGGYFDADGKVHYIISDYQGSAVMVVDSLGTVEQHNSYYPYGELHRSPTGQQRLYIGKERIDETGTYDYGPRDFHAAGLYWQAPDIKAGDYAGTNSYILCAGNPIRNTDPTGMKVWKMNETGYIIGGVDNDKDDYIILVNEKNEEISRSKKYKAGTITVDDQGKVIDPNTDEQLKDKEGNPISYLSLKVDGDAAGTEVFEFLAGELTANGSHVEFSLIQVGEEENGTNYITTSHQRTTEAGAGQLYRNKLVKGYYIRSLTHSHPGTNPAGEGDKNTKTRIIENQQTKNTMKNIPKFKVYHSSTGTYSQY